MQRYFLPKSIIFLLAVFFAFACNPSSNKTKAPVSPQEKLSGILKDELKLEMVIKQAGKTLWLYYPREESFIILSAGDEEASVSKEYKESLSVNFLDTTFDGKTFKVDYDIGSVKAYEKNYGYTTGYQESFRQEQQNILSSVYRSFADEKTKPDFVVLVVTDITLGLEMTTYMAFNDLLRAFQDMSFGEEYTRRIVMETPKGSKSFIGDKKGRHLDFRELTWGEFLAKQITYRVQYKYTRSAFRPGPDTEKELLNIIIEAISAYDYIGFSEVVLSDLASKLSKSFPQQDILKRSADLKKNPPGRYIELKFM
ncbi:MAG: hypothetical protein HQL27_08130 [Candidatus Omnitrophica bacterium]|nr:hypothetical protein [Candidatus Omnitrophota bacterium]